MSVGTGQADGAGEEQERLAAVHLHAEVSGQGNATLAGRDVHIHYEDGGPGARRAAPGTDPGRCPYPGLAGFTAEQARWFFGRDALTAQLAARAAGRLREGGPLLVTGASGAGKSSLLRAGLLAGIAGRAVLPEEGSRHWPQLLLTPTAHPLRELHRHLTAQAHPDSEGLPPEPEREPDGARLARLARQVLAARGGGRIVIIVDQLEELFTLCSEDRERQEFLTTLAGIAAPGPGGPAGLVVYGLRADAYAACVSCPGLKAALEDGQVVVGPMTRGELRQAIVFPARDAGLDLEPGLPELLLRDLGDGRDGYEAGRLPLLAHALRVTWQQRHGHTLTVAGYQASGGIHDAVATTAGRVYGRLDDAGRQAARVLFLRLVKIGDGTGDTRRAVPAQVLLRDSPAPDATAAALDAFTSGRLLTREHDTVTITHEALLRAWPQLSAWIEEDRAADLTRQQLEETAAAWERDQHDAAHLWRGTRLDAARAWTAGPRQDRDLGASARAFYRASARQHARARTRRRAVAALLCAITLTATAAAVIAVQQRSAVIQQRSKAQAELADVTAAFLTSEAAQLRVVGKDLLAEQLDVTAWELQPYSDLPVQDPDLYSALVTDATVTVAPRRAQGSPYEISGMLFAPRGRLLALTETPPDDSPSSAALIQLWNTTVPGRPRYLGYRTTNIVVSESTGGAAISPDGGILTVDAGDGQTVAWDITRPGTPAPPLLISSDACPATGSAPLYTCDGATAFTGTAFTGADTLAVGRGGPSLPSYVQLYTLTGHLRASPAGPPVGAPGMGIMLLAADARSHLLAAQYGPVSSTDPPVRIWDVADPTRPRLLPFPVVAGEQDSQQVAFNPGAPQLAAYPAGPSGGIQLWNLASPGHPRELGRIPDPNSTSGQSSFSYDASGRVLAVLDPSSNLVTLWNVSNPDSPVLADSITGLAGDQDGLALSADGTLIATLGDDDSVNLWNLDVEDDVRLICASTPGLTYRQWQRYAPGLPYKPPCQNPADR